MKRSANRQIGKDAENRIAKQLECFGIVQKSMGDQEPDFVLTKRNGMKFAVEAKSIKPISGGSVGRINFRNLKKLETWAEKHSATFLAVIELRLPRYGNLYYALIPEALSPSFTLYRVLRFGLPLATYFGIWRNSK